MTKRLPWQAHCNFMEMRVIGGVTMQMLELKCRRCGMEVKIYKKGKGMKSEVTWWLFEQGGVVLRRESEYLEKYTGPYLRPFAD